jgi:hypothetical protein
MSHTDTRNSTGLTVATIFAVLQNNSLAKKVCLSLIVIQMYAWVTAVYSKRYPEAFDKQV